MTHSLVVVIVTLSCTQLVVILLVLGLGREVYSLKLRNSGLDEWPLETLFPGDALPDELVKHIASKHKGTEHNGFYLYATSIGGLAQMVTALSVLCDRWRYPLFCISADPTVVERITSEDELNCNIHVSLLPERLRCFARNGNTVLYVKRGRIVDATASASTPSALRRKFEFVAER